MFKEINTCPISNSKDYVTYLDLGLMPLVNNLNNTKEESLNCTKVPLKVNFYPSSGLSMLSHIVDPNVLFSHYVYKSGTSQPYIDHCKEMFYHIDDLTHFFRTGIPLVVDIGGNDGSLLNTFKSLQSNIDVLNVDPSDVTEISISKGIPTHRGMWNSDFAKTLENKCSVITSTNVFQHLEDIDDFVKGISIALKENGIWCLEFPYWKENLETYQYDQIYHEHIYYYLVTPLIKLFYKHGLRIKDYRKLLIHGGSMRILIEKSKQPSLLDYPFVIEEKKLNADYHIKWGQHIKSNIIGDKQFIYYLKHQGYKVVGFGAAAKGCIFLNTCEIDSNFMSYVVDDTDSKQGKFIPGTGIPIVSREKLIQDPPDYIVILAHNFAKYITESLRPIFKGKFITMFPEIKIYE